MYTITVEAHELEIIRHYLPTLAATAKPVRARKAAAPAPFEPNTGNPQIDAFMRAHHRVDYKPLPLPKPTDLKGTKRGGDRRPLSIVLAEAEDVARREGWPGRYNVLGTRADVDTSN